MAFLVAAPLVAALPRQPQWMSPRALPLPKLKTRPSFLTKDKDVYVSMSAHLRTAPDDSATTTMSNSRRARVVAVAVRPCGAQGLWRPPLIRSLWVMRLSLPLSSSSSSSPATWRRRPGLAGPSPVCCHLWRHQRLWCCT